MNLKYKIRCSKFKSKDKKFNNNFVENISLYKVNSKIFKIRIDLKHRHFTIDAFCSSTSDNSQGVMFSYNLDPHKLSSEKGARDEYFATIDFLGFPSEKYELKTDRDKNTLEIIFIKRSKEVLLDDRKLRPKKV